MSRGRPRKKDNQSLFIVQNWIEYTSDSDSDNINVQRNVRYEIEEGSLRSLQRQEPDEQEEEEEETDKQEEEEQPDDQEEEPDEQEEEEDEQEDNDNDEDLDQHEQHQQQNEEYGNEDDEHPEEEVENNQEIGLNEEYGPHEEQHPEEEVDENQEIGPHEEQQQQQQQQQQPNPFDDFLRIMDDDERSEDLEQHLDYDTVFEKLKSEWLMTEITHHVSKTATDAFWSVGLKYFSMLSAARGRRKKTPQFKSIRRKIYLNSVPPVNLEIGYKDRTTNEIHIVNDTCTPLKRFSPTKFDKIFEIASIKVSL